MNSRTLFVLLASLYISLSGCGGDSNDSTDTINSGGPFDNSHCGYTGKIAGELNYDINHDINAGCGGALTVNSELITSFGGIGSEPNIKIYHENFVPVVTGTNFSAHIVIRKNSNDNREWRTNLGACNIQITTSQKLTAVANNNNVTKVWIKGTGNCTSTALPDTNSGATADIVIAPFTFDSMWITYTP